MNRRGICFMLLSGALVGLAVNANGPQDQKKQDPAAKAPPKAVEDAAARKAILANVRAYMDAYNRQDIKAIVSLFAENCDITEHDGTRIHGRKELGDELRDNFASDPKAQISVAMDSLTFVTPDVAIEVGKTTFYPDGKTLTAETEYQVTHVRAGKTWLMLHARGFNRKVLSPYDRLRDLEWLVGDWVDESDESLIEASYRWDANKTFLLQDFTIRVKGQKVLSGTQRIGWDPLAMQVKSWVFDSEGGFGESLWSNVDYKRVIKVQGVRADGKVVTATNEITQMAKDRLRFESLDRIVGEDRRPSFTAFAVRRPPSPKD